MAVDNTLKYRLAEGTKKIDNLISLTSSAHFDPIFRSHDPTSESVRKGSGHLRKSSERQEKGGEDKNQGGVGRGGQKVRRVGWVGDDVIEKIKNKERKKNIYIYINIKNFKKRNPIKKRDYTLKIFSTVGF